MERSINHVMEVMNFIKELDIDTWSVRISFSATSANNLHRKSGGMSFISLPPHITRSIMAAASYRAHILFTASGAVRQLCPELATSHHQSHLFSCRCWHRVRFDARLRLTEFFSSKTKAGLPISCWAGGVPSITQLTLLGPAGMQRVTVCHYPAE